STSLLIVLFFFSSRRRHTRWPRDWSSDVCSSDLFALRGQRLKPAIAIRIRISHQDNFPFDADAVLTQQIVIFRVSAVRVDDFCRSEERRVGKEWSYRRWRAACDKKLVRTRRRHSG